MNKNTKPKEIYNPSELNILDENMTSLQKEFMASMGNCLGYDSEDLKNIRNHF